LVKTGKHTVTALTRNESTGTVPEGAKVARVNFDDEDSLVSALKGQQFLVISLSVRAADDTHSKIVKAAAKAGIHYVMPNVYSYDLENKNLQGDDMYTQASLKLVKEIESLGMSWIALSCGFWYEWSLALSEHCNCFGIDIRNKKAVFFDDGNAKICTSTWPQCGAAVAGLLSLPETGASPCVADWKNKCLFVNSFNVSQRDMLDSVHRVIGTSDKDWEIKHESSADRVKEGMEAMKKGDHAGFMKAMYSRIFYPGGDGDFEAAHGTVNELFGLPKEHVDAGTKRTVEMIESGWKPW
jgi:hypothetical protein